MFHFRVRWSPVSFCSKMQLMLTSRTLRAEDPSTTPPCWATLGLSSTSSSSSLLHQALTQRILIGRSEECDATLIMFYAPKITKKKLFSVFQASVFILKKGSKSKCCRHWRENTPNNSGGGGQRRHRHTVRVIFIIIIICFNIVWLNFHTVRHNQPAQLSSTCNYLGFGA